MKKDTVIYLKKPVEECEPFSKSTSARGASSQSARRCRMCDWRGRRHVHGKIAEF